uniref:Uncharacterized protein n=1 Tax=Rhodnius prolixus TaxID=13249 RepID=T1IBV2_RHOPR
MAKIKNMRGKPAPRRVKFKVFASKLICRRSVEDWYFHFRGQSLEACNVKHPEGFIYLELVKKRVKFIATRV